MHLRSVRGVERAITACGGCPSTYSGIGDCRATEVLDHMPDDIDAESVNALVEPEPHHPVHAPPLRDYASSDPVVSPEKHDSSIAGLFIALPRRCRRKHSASCLAGLHLVWGLSRCTSRVWIVARRAALEEPGMFVGAMVGHQVEDHLHSGGWTAPATLRSRPSFRTADRFRYNRRCRSRNRPSVKERSATARSRRRQASPDTADDR